MSSTDRGAVKQFNGQNGYGFIQQDAGQKNIFVHIFPAERAGLRTLKNGRMVSYEW